MLKIYFNDALATSIGHTICYFACVWLAQWWAPFITIGKIVLALGVVVCVLKLLTTMFSLIFAIDFRDGRWPREFVLAILIGLLVIVPGMVAGYFYLQLVEGMWW